MISSLLTLLPLLAGVPALTLPTKTGLTNSERLARGLPLAKPVNLFNPSRVRPRQAEGSGRPTPVLRSVCEAYDPATFGVSCVAPGDTSSNGGACCTDTPGGQFLLTQFWDSGLSALGPEESWTIHGLWPDNCDGTWEEYCDASRERSNIREILLAAGESDMVAYFDQYWKSNSGNDESFWAHEWNKHGTCISSLETQCFVGYQDQSDLVQYFRKSLTTFQELPTYEWLASDGIVPSLDVTYTRAEIDASLRKHFGREVVFKCRSGALNEMWYHYNSVGGIVTGELIPGDPVGSGTNCPATGIRYLPKYVAPGEPPSTVPAPQGSAPAAIDTRAYVYAVYEDGTMETDTCLISAGTWYRGGTCATYRTQAAPAGSPEGAFQLTSSRGLCRIGSAQRFECVAGTMQADAATFTFNERGRLRLVAGGPVGEGFSSASTPSGNVQVPVILGLGEDVGYGLYFVPL